MSSRSANGVFPQRLRHPAAVLLIYAYRGELVGAVYTRRPLGQFGRGAMSVAGMYTNFGGLARLPLADATAISFASR
ncbi:MAG: hypothetical protein WDN48_11610 [Pseudolabrys sp.]